MLPAAFLERMQRMLGDEYEAFLNGFGHENDRALRLNPLKINLDGETAAEKYGFWVRPDTADTPASTAAHDTGFAHLTKVPWAENGYYYEAEDQPGKHPFHDAGLYYIQEPSAMAPAELLEVCPGERVLDLCAAPGGKSTLLAEKLKGQGLLVCNEIHPARAKILSENIERMGIVNACVTNESPVRLVSFFAGYFDKILVDAPCSGEGMFRKNETACEEWSPENVKLCAGRQDEILDCAADMLLPGGRLMYSTCTFAPEENEGSVSRFLQRHTDFSLCAIDKKKYGWEGCDGVPSYVESPAAGLENTLRLMPHRIKGEGHFAALLQKDGVPREVLRGSETGVRRTVPDRELGEFPQFCRESLKTETLWEAVGGSAVGGRFIKFGEQLYLIPDDMPELKGLKVLRPGLHLGEFKKNRFEPSHALALALLPSRARHIWNLSSDAAEVRAYLNGQTFSAEGEKGWYLICVDGYGLGWGKLAGGVMKNHYPKGLRIPERNTHV